MSAPSDPRHGDATPSRSPSTQEIPVVPSAGSTASGSTSAGSGRGGALPAPGQQPPHPVAPPLPAVPPQPVAPPPVAPPPVAPPPSAHTSVLPPAWPDTLADEPSPPTRPAGAADGVQPTGPVDFVPGLPGVGAEHPTPAPAKRRTPAPDRTAIAAIVLAALAVGLLQFGLTRGRPDLWNTVTLWSVFATAATVLGLAVLVVRLVAPARLPAGIATRLLGGAVLALAIFWLLVVLPIVASDPGFLVTAALLCLGGALWLGPARRR